MAIKGRLCVVLADKLPGLETSQTSLLFVIDDDDATTTGGVLLPFREKNDIDIVERLL
jgi:hypothetical protein